MDLPVMGVFSILESFELSALNNKGCCRRHMHCWMEKTVVYACKYDQIIYVDMSRHTPVHDDHALQTLANPMAICASEDLYGAGGQRRMDQI